MNRRLPKNLSADRHAPKTVVRKSHKGLGENTLIAGGVIILGLMLSTMGIDVGMYMNAQNQLQTVVNTAALAGASKLPVGTSQAYSRAQYVASENKVLGQTLTPAQLTIQTTATSVAVNGKTPYAPMIMQAFCQSGLFNTDKTTQGQAAVLSSASCGTMDVVASAKAIPAARDTMLVIDTSSSMLSLGNNRPLRDVQQAANLFITMVASQATQSSDRIGLVKFDQQGYLQIGLTSQQQSTGYSTVKSKVNGLTTFNGSGWNTNYTEGLKKALDELQANGRANAQKRIIFMTDGMPNLPAPANYYTYNRNEPYRKCTDPVNNSTVVKNLCTRNSKGQLVCPVLPSTSITNNMINATAVSCGQGYTSFMEAAANAQTDRAEAMKVVIDTIQISEDNATDNATGILRRLIKQPGWDPQQLAYMRDTTQGKSYEARNYDAARITAIYQEAAKQIRVKLTNN
jgi:hypothetical protein